MLGLGSIAAITALGACSSLFETGCKTNAASSFDVTVHDSITGASIEAGSRLFWTGPSTDSIVVPNDVGNTGLPIAGPFEQSGTFHVIVRHSGYRDWSRDVRVTSDRCHVKPVSVTALMQPSLVR
jgi:hypothetical protein